MLSTLKKRRSIKLFHPWLARAWSLLHINFTWITMFHKSYIYVRIIDVDWSYTCTLNLTFGYRASSVFDLRLSYLESKYNSRNTYNVEQLLLSFSIRNILLSYAISRSVGKNSNQNNLFVWWTGLVIPYIAMKLWSCWWKAKTVLYSFKFSEIYF